MPGPRHGVTAGWRRSILQCLRLRSLGSGNPSVVTARWETRSGRWRPRRSCAWNTVSTRGADRQGLITTDTAPAEARRLGPEGGEWYETAEQYYPYFLNFQKN